MANEIVVRSSSYLKNVQNPATTPSKFAVFTGTNNLLGFRTGTELLTDLNITSTNITNFTEAVQDVVGAFLQSGSGIIATYNDAGNIETIAIDTNLVATTTNVLTLTNKTLTSPTINTPILTVNDNQFTIQDDGDNTKKAQFQASGISASTTRTYTLPNANGTLALTSDLTGYILQSGNSFSGPMYVGTNDANNLLFETNDINRVTITGTGGAVGGAVTISNTNSNISTIQDVLTIQGNSNNVTTPAAGYGVAILMQGESSTTDNRDMVRLTASWINSTDSNRTSVFSIGSIYTSGTFTDFIYFTNANSGTIQLGSASSAFYTNAGIAINTTYTIGNSANTINIGGSSQSNQINIESSNSSFNGISLLARSATTGISVGTNSTTPSTAVLWVGNSTFNSTSVSAEILKIAGTYSPNGAGTSNWHGTVVTTTINQTTHTGITRGHYVNPTLTAVADWRSFESAVNNANAFGLYIDGVLTKNYIAGSLGVGTTSPDRVIHSETSDSTTTTVVYGGRFTHITSGTASVGFGVGVEYELENGSNTNRVASTQEISWSDATNATEDATYKLRLIKNGTLTDALTVTSVGDTTIAGGLTLGSSLVESYGGTHQTNYVTGDILIATGTNTLARLAIGSNGNVLTISSGLPAWGSASAGTVTSVNVSDSVEIDLTISGSTTVNPTITAVLLPTTVSAASYGSASSVPTFTVDSKGRLTAASNTAIAIASTAITDFTEGVQDVVGAFLQSGSGIIATYNDAGNVETIAIDTNLVATTTNTLTMSNKTLTSPTINTPVLTVNDNQFTIQDDGDSTKKAQFQASSISASTTRTYTLPNANGTIILGSGTTGVIPKYSSNFGITDSKIFETTNTVSVGTALNIDTFTRFYVYGGNQGANADFRGAPGAATDQAVVDVQASDYATNFNSIYLKYAGPTFTGNDFLLSGGTIPLANLGELTYGGPSNFIIRSVLNVPIRFGVNNTEIAKLTTSGYEIRNGKSLFLYDSDNTQSIEIKAPSTSNLTTSYTLTLPTTDGNANEYLKTDGTGVLSWGVVNSISDGDKGDITVTASGATWTIDAGVITNTKLASGTGGIYKSSGTVPTSVIATLTDTLEFRYASGNTALGIQGTLGVSILSPNNNSFVTITDSEISANLDTNALYSIYYSGGGGQGFVLDDSGGSASLRGKSGDATLSLDSSLTYLSFGSTSITMDGITNTLMGDVIVSDSFNLAGDISPSTITSNQNNYNPTGLSTASTLRILSDAARNITGLANGADGRIIILHNIGSFPITLKTQSTSSTAANRFAFTEDIVIAGGEPGGDSALLRYDSTASRWRYIGIYNSLSGSTTTTTRVYLNGTGTTFDLDSGTTVVDRNGSNTSFTFPADLDSVFVVRGGQMMYRSGDSTPVRDYSLNAATNEITFTSSVSIDENILIYKT